MLAIVGLTLSSSLAGCSSDGVSESQCRLIHEIVEPSDDLGEVAETYRYEGSSSDAQQVFKEAIDNGSYATTNQSLESAEFRYWDTTTRYNITYRNGTYVLLAYTGEGCESK